MFTGIIEDVGQLVSERSGAKGGRVLTIATRFPVDSLALGDSVAVNGTCLTVVERRAAGEGSHFAVDAGPETLLRTTTGALRAGSRVNLERALTPTTRLGGHLVSGHVDAVGTIERIDARENAYDLVVTLPRPLMRLVADRGSVTVDGISLTVTGVGDDRFTLSIIPHTWRVTALAERRVGSAVNVEVDVLARYVQRLAETRHLDPAPAAGAHGSGGLTEALLEANGFGRRG
jgi:riboflavin synthase